VRYDTLLALTLPLPLQWKSCTAKFHSLDERAEGAELEIVGVENGAVQTVRSAAPLSHARELGDGEQAVVF